MPCFPSALPRVPSNGSPPDLTASPNNLETDIALAEKQRRLSDMINQLQRHFEGKLVSEKKTHLADSLRASVTGKVFPQFLCE